MLTCTRRSLLLSSWKQIYQSPTLSPHHHPRFKLKFQLNYIHTTPPHSTPSSTLTNILASDIPPPVIVKSISPSGIELADGLLIPGACIFLEGKVFLWDVPTPSTTAAPWGHWQNEHFEIFESVVPRPELLLLGTGQTVTQISPSLRKYLTSLGIQVDVMDTRNASSTYNLLSEEGRRVAAALLPLTPYKWQKHTLPAR